MIGRITTAGSADEYTNATISGPDGIAAGADGALWFTNLGDNSIGRITTAGAVAAFPGLINGPVGIAAGADGALWFTNYTDDSIGRITTTGTVTRYTGTGIDHPFGITAGPDGALWFTNLYNDSIGRITTSGTVTNYTGTGIDGPYGITTGSDGALWFTNTYNDSIGRISTSGTVTNYTGTGIRYPDGIAAGADGALWFANNGNNSIGRISTSGTVTNYTGTGINGPSGITAGPDGALWFTNQNNNPPSIGRITTGGTVTNYTGTGISSPGAIAAGPDGALWFANSYSVSTGYDASIGRITTGGTVTNFSGGGGANGIAAGPDGDLWFTGNNAIGRISTGTVSASVSTVSAGPGSVPADGSTHSTITVVLKDGHGIAVPGKTVALGQGGGHSVISAASGPSDSSGRVTFTVTDTVVENVTYTATDATDGLTVAQTAGVGFTVGPASAAQSTLNASPGSVPADGSSHATITVTLKDASGRAVPGKNVTLAQGGRHSIISAPSGPSDSNGRVTFTVTDTTAEAVTYTATDTTDAVQMSATAAVSFTPVPAAPLFTGKSPPLTTTIGSPYSYAFSATGYPAPTFALAAGAPDWLSVNATTGVVSGTPPTGTDSFAYRVIASNGVMPDAAAGPSPSQSSSERRRCRSRRPHRSARWWAARTT